MIESLLERAGGERAVVGMAGEGVLRELRALQGEGNPTLFSEALLSLARRLENADQVDLAALFYSVLNAAEIFPPAQRRCAQTRLDAIQGRGEALPRMEFLGRRLAREASDPAMIAAMAAGGIASRAVRLAGMGRLASSSASVLTRGWGARAIVGTAAFAAETVAFTAGGRAARAARGETQDWSGRGLWHEYASGAISLLGLRLMGSLAGAAVRRWGTNPSMTSGLVRSLLPQIGMFGGIWLGRRLEAGLGLRTLQSGETEFIDTLATLLNFHVGGRLAHHALGENWRRLEAHLDERTEILQRENSRTIPPPSRISRIIDFARDVALMPMWWLVGIGGPGASIRLRSRRSGPPSEPPPPLQAEFLEEFRRRLVAENPSRPEVSEIPSLRIGIRREGNYVYYPPFQDTTHFFSHRPDIIQSVASELRNLFPEQESGIGRSAIDLYETLCSKYLLGAEELLAGAQALRGLFLHPENGERAIDAYPHVLRNLPDRGEELHQGARALRKIFQNEDGRIQRAAVGSYDKLVNPFHANFNPAELRKAYVALLPLGSEFNATYLRSTIAYHIELPRRWTYALARELFQRWSKDTQDSLFEVPYSNLVVHRFHSGDAEVYRQVSALIELLRRVDPDTRKSRFAVESVIHILPYFRAADRAQIRRCFWQIFGLLPILNAGSRERIVYGLTAHFQKFHEAGLWEELADAGWMEGLGFDAATLDQIRQRLLRDRGRVLTSRDRWRTLLRYVSDLDEARRDILRGLLAGEGKSRDIFSALATVQLIPEEFRDEVTQELAAEISTWPVRASSEVPGRAARVRHRIYETLRGLLSERLREDPHTPRAWEANPILLDTLYRNGSLDLFLRSAFFMDEQGRSAVGVLMDEMAASEIVRGEIRYQRRYEELVPMGFHPDFVQAWAGEYHRDLTADRPRDPTQARTLVFAQAVTQISSHLGAVPAEAGGGLPEEVRHFLASLQNGEMDNAELTALLANFERDYTAIRRRWGDGFANIRTDLKNLSDGLTRAPAWIGGEETLQITGNPEEIAASGNEPVETCQRLTGFWSETSNGRGQPIHRILHGQFKLANYRVRGEVVARRYLEITRNAEGRAALLVHRLYSNGRFVSSAEFRSSLLAYAQSLGIDAARVYFAEDDLSGTPRPLDTGDAIYRDTWDHPIPASEVPPQAEP